MKIFHPTLAQVENFCNLWTVQQPKHATTMNAQLISELLAAYMMALLAGNDEAADHFAARIAEEDAKASKSA